MECNYRSSVSKTLNKPETWNVNAGFINDDNNKIEGGQRHRKY